MNPSLEMLVFAYKDSDYNGNLTRLCRMARAWKEKMNVLMPGILIDTIAYQFLADYKYAKESYTFFDWMSRDFFNYIIQNESTTTWYKFGSTGTVKKEYSASVNTDSKKAHALALEAISAGASDMYYTWHNKWRDIYGSKFPSA